MGVYLILLLFALVALAIDSVYLLTYGRPKPRPATTTASLPAKP